MTRSDDQTLQQALHFLQTGKAHDAEVLLKKLLAAAPRHIGGLNVYGILLSQAGRFAEAETYLRRALAENATSDATLYNYGTVLKALKRPADALEQFNKALAINGAVAATWNNRGTVLNDLGRYRDAIADFDRAVALEPNYAEAFCNKGKSLAELRLLDQALASYERALALRADFAEAWLGCGAALADLNRAGDALSAYERAVALKPTLAEAWLGRGEACSMLGRGDDALAAYERALTLDPALAAAWVGRGNLFFKRKAYDDALAAYAQASTLDAQLAEAWLGRGNIFSERRQGGEALAAYDQALALKPDLAEAWLGRGNVLARGNRAGDALAAYDKALALKPALAEAWVGRGNALAERGEDKEAGNSYDKALALKADLAQAWLGRGNILSKRMAYDEAFAAYDKALALQPDLAEAWLGRGNNLNRLSHRKDEFAAEALAAFDRACALDPDLKFAQGNRLHAKQRLCDWSDIDAEAARLVQAIRAGKPACQPFQLLSIAATPADQLLCARLCIAQEPSFAPQPIDARAPHERIRVAYVSSDLREHPVAYLTAGLFERHDRARFEVTAISLGPDDDSDMRRRLKNAFEHFIDANAQSDQEIADTMRRLDIDIAIDLNGFTEGGRRGIFARRPAPIQLSYLGFPGSLGADYIDYIIADRFVIPEQERAHYSEQAVYLPDCFQANDDQRRMSERVPLRADVGLPAEGFVFCAFSNSQKITPAAFDIWMRLLRAVDGSVLWLLGAGTTVERNLRQEAQRRGVDAARLVFASRVPYADYLARYQLADLFLDTLHFNAGTTASDVLWAGLPLVTCAGRTYAARMAGSLLTAMAMPETIAASPQDYEALALALARDPARLKALREKLARPDARAAAFGTKRFTAHLEAAYTTMWERHRRGETPQSFAIAAAD